MSPFLALLAFLQAAHVPTQQVRIPEPNGTILKAALVRPPGPVHGAAIVALHGCGGPFPTRDGPWAVALAEAGHVVLLPDSFGSRGLGSQCRVKQRSVRALPTRRADAIAAAEWLAARPGTPAGGVVLMGWSNGGSTTLWTADAAWHPPPGLFRRFVAFYPGCMSETRSATYRPAAPLLILVGANDDWTPAAPCRTLAARFPAKISLTVYPDSWHDFDAPGRAVRVPSGLATPPSGTGQAHTGTNDAARQDALRVVPAFIDAP
ncbi:MAG TPA: dienelactone hydrolase family protein [Acetobacteraceae bacterium]